MNLSAISLTHVSAGDQRAVLNGPSLFPVVHKNRTTKHHHGDAAVRGDVENDQQAAASARDAAACEHVQRADRGASGA